MSQAQKKSGHPLSSLAKRDINTSPLITGREYSQIKVNRLATGQPIASSSIPIVQTNTHRSCLKHRPDGSYLRENNCQPSLSLQDDETGRLSSTEGNTSGRVSFARPALSDTPLLPESTIKVPLPADPLEKKRRSAIFAKKAKELRLAELNYFRDHARDFEPTEE